MVFQPGQSGNPGGKFKDKPLTDALRMELAEPSDFRVHKRSPRALARAQLDRAARGDTIAFREVADRLEGRVPQAIGAADDLSPLQLIITGVPRPEPVTVEHQPVALEQGEEPETPDNPDNQFG